MVLESIMNEFQSQLFQLHVGSVEIFVFRYDVIYLREQQRKRNSLFLSCSNQISKILGDFGAVA